MQVLADVLANISEKALPMFSESLRSVVKTNLLGLCPNTPSSALVTHLSGSAPEESRLQQQRLQKTPAIENDQKRKIRLQQKRLNTAQPRANESCQDQEARLRQMRG